MNILAPKPEYVQNLSAILRGMVQELPIEDQANSIERAIPRILTQVRQTYVGQFVVLVFSYEMAMILRGTIQGSPVLSNIVELAPTSDGQSGFLGYVAGYPAYFLSVQEERMVGQLTVSVDPYSKVITYVDAFLTKGI